MRRPALALLLGCLLLVAGASALDGYDYYQTIEYAGCDQDVYQQDIVIHRSTGTAYNETAGGLEIWHIYVGEHCRADYGDLRFTNSTGAELAYYLWPDFDATSARVCVRLEGADAAGTVTVHYGNPTATTTSDGDAVYAMLDQFSGSALGAAWSIPHPDQIEVSDGFVYNHLISGSYNTISRSLTVGPQIIEMRGKMPESGYHVYISPGITVQMLNNAKTYQYYNSAGSPTSVSRAESFEAFRAVRSIISALGFAVYVDGALAYSADTTYYASHAPICQFGGESDGDVVLDYVLIRAYSATPPAATTFSGEQETAAPPVTAFTATPTAGLAPLTVTFTDTSTGSPTAWSWSFGDGGTSSTDQNPQHTYTTPGTYSVTLTATNEYGSTPATKLDYITVYGPITAQFTTNITGGTAPLTVQFTDRSTGGPTSWSWSFGDGNTSTAQNPAHTYTTAGTHTVTLTASHPYDSDTETKPAYIIVAVLQPFPGLTNIPRDLTGNGLYTDINGNNRLDYNDLTIFFQNLAWAKTAQPIACFDFNGNGWLDYNDVIALFSIIMEEHT